MKGTEPPRSLPLGGIMVLYPMFFRLTWLSDEVGVHELGEGKVATANKK